MSKLNFSNPLENNSLFAEETSKPKKQGRPRSADLVREKGAQNGLREDSVRYTVIFKKSTMQFLKDYAFTKRITIKDALAEMIEKFEEEYKANPENEPLISKEDK